MYTTRLRRAGQTLAAGLAALLLAGACSSTNAAPTATVLGATSSPLASPTALPTEAPTAAPSESPSPVASATPVASPSASATSPASACTGTAANQDFFALAASKLKFDIYCAVLPKGWFVQSGSYSLTNGGMLSLSYKTSHGATFDVSEGAFCTTSPAACSSHVSIVGPASFASLTGTLDIMTASPLTYALYVNPGTKVAYSATGTGMTVAQVTSYAAAMFRVPMS